MFIARDASANFRFAEFDKLEFRPEAVDRDLTALLAYYAYMIIGIDLDTMSPLGGTDVLGRARDLVNNARSLSLSAKGWKRLRRQPQTATASSPTGSTRACSPSAA